MIIFLLIWLLLVCRGIRIKKDIQFIPFSKENSLIIRGISAAEIMLGHIGLATGSFILYPNRKAGVLFVGIFLALSGYGLMYSREKNSDYMKGFLLKRLKSVLLPAYIVYFLFIVFKIIQTKQVLGIIDLINPKVFFLNTNWYIWEIIFLYIVFYVCSRFVKQMTNLILCISIVFIFTAYFIGLDNPWYGSTLCFVFGMWYYENQKWVEKKVVDHYITILLLGLLITGGSILSFILLGNGSIFGNPIARNIASTAFVCVIISALYKVSVGNKVSAWCGRHSYEIYLFHIMYINILKKYFLNNPLIYGISIVFATIVSSWIYKKVEKYLAHRIKLNKRYLDEGIS